MKIPAYPIRPVRRVMRESFDFGGNGLLQRFDARERAEWRGPQDLTFRRRPMIMLAEDDGPMRSLLTSQLRRDGYRVIACEDGAEFVQRIEAYRSHQVPVGIDLLISDVRMPLISGLELLELVKETPLRLPVILISAFGDIETRCEAAKRDAAAFFSKPFDLDLLRTAVASNLRTQH